MPRKKKIASTDTKIWQPVQIRFDERGETLRTTNLGVPRCLEDAKKIVEYRNAVEIRSGVRYSMTQVAE